MSVNQDPGHRGGENSQIMQEMQMYCIVKQSDRLNLIRLVSLFHDYPIKVPFFRLNPSCPDCPINEGFLLVLKH